MSPGRISAGIGVAGLAICGMLAAAGQAVLPSYLAAWLFVMALPLGALTLVMLFELLDVSGWAIVPLLRRMLLLLPAGALFAIPVMAGAVALYHRPGLADSLPDWWMEPTFLVVRMVVMLLVWTAFALLFARAPRDVPRRGLATVGLLLTLAMGSLAALDWVMSLDPGVGSSVFGLMLIVAQLGTALSAAVFLLSINAKGRTLPGELPPLMAAALGAWLFLHFIQYLVVWSADLPKEIVWYQLRSLDLGVPAVWTVFAMAALGLAVLLPYRLSRTPWVMASIAAMLLLAHLIEVFWLVTPPFRGGVMIALADVPALAGLCGLVAFVLLTLQHRQLERAHAAA